MGRNKARHNPDKPQNKLGKYCSYYENNNTCEKGWDTTKCKGNPHNCVKVEYQILASRSDIQKNNGVGITNKHR